MKIAPILICFVIVSSSVSCVNSFNESSNTSKSDTIPKKELKLVWKQELFLHNIEDQFEDKTMNIKINFMDLPQQSKESIVLPWNEGKQMRIVSLDANSGKFQWKTEGSWAYAKLNQNTIHTKKTEHNVEAFLCIDLASGQLLWTITHKEVYPPSMRWYMEGKDTLFSYTSNLPGFNIEQDVSISAYSKQNGEKLYEHTYNQQAYLIPLILNDATLCLLFHDRLILLDIPSGDILEEHTFTEKKDLSDYVNAELIDRTLYIFKQQSLEAILIPQNKTLWSINLDDPSALENDTFTTEGSPVLIQANDIIVFYTQNPSQVLAVDAKTGTIRWKQQNLPQSFFFKPMKHSKLPIILSVNEKGNLFGFDSLTGEIQWISSTMPGLNTQIIEYETGFLLGEEQSTELYFLDATSGQLSWFVDVPFWHPIFPKLTVWGSYLGIISDKGVFHVFDLPTESQG